MGSWGGTCVLMCVHQSLYALGHLFSCVHILMVELLLGGAGGEVIRTVLVMLLFTEHLTIYIQALFSVIVKLSPHSTLGVLQIRKLMLSWMVYIRPHHWDLTHSWADTEAKEGQIFGHHTVWVPAPGP